LFVNKYFIRNNTPTITTHTPSITQFERSPNSITSYSVNSGLTEWIKAVLTVG